VSKGDKWMNNGYSAVKQLQGKKLKKCNVARLVLCPPDGRLPCVLNYHSFFINSRFTVTLLLTAPSCKNQTIYLPMKCHWTTLSFNVSSDRKTYETSTFYNQRVFICTMTCSTA